MSWSDALQQLIASVGGVQGMDRLSEEKIQRVSRLFFDQEVYPCMSRLRDRLAAGNYEVVLHPAKQPPEGMTWNLEAVELEVQLPKSVEYPVAMRAGLLVEYNSDFILSGSTKLDGESTEVEVLSILGDPVAKLESWVEAFERLIREMS